MKTTGDNDILEARDVYTFAKKILRGIVDGRVKPQAANSFAQVVTSITNMAKVEHQIHEVRGTKSTSGFLPDADDDDRNDRAVPPRRLSLPGR